MPGLILPPTLLLRAKGCSAFPFQSLFEVSIYLKVSQTKKRYPYFGTNDKEVLFHEEIRCEQTSQPEKGYLETE